MSRQATSASSSSSLSQRFLAVVFAVVMGTVLACGLILGIDDERPIRGNDAAAVMTDAAGMDADAALGCEKNESLGCAKICPHEFCSDFDVSGQPPDLGWQAPLGIPNPFIRPAAEAGIEVAAPGLTSQPQSLHVTIGSETSSSYGMLGHQLDFAKRHDDKQAFDGVRVAADVRIDQLRLGDVGGSPIEDAGAGAVLGLLRPSVASKPKGVALLATSSEGFFLSVSEDVLGGAGQSVVANLGVKVSLANVLRATVRAEIFVGPHPRAAALGYSGCPVPAAANGLVVAAVLGNGTFGRACIELPANFDVPAGPRSWAEGPVLLVGGLLFGPGSAELRIDNAVADFYSK